MERIYTKNFISQVLEAFPNSKMIQDALNSGSEILGRYLDDGCGRITPDDVLKLNEEQLKKKARRIQLQEKVYADFVSGKCYLKEALQERRCPIWYIRDYNLPWDIRKPIEDIVCGKGNYCFSFYACKHWDCKSECWKRFEKYIKEKNINLDDFRR